MRVLALTFIIFLVLAVGWLIFDVARSARVSKPSPAEQIRALPPSQRKYYDISLRSSALLQGLIRADDTLGTMGSVFPSEEDREEATAIVHDFYQEVDRK